MLRSLPFTLLLATLCVSCVPETMDRDAGLPGVEPSTDAGGADASPGPDASAPQDAGPPADSGSRVDAGMPADSGTPADAGTPDAGSIPDAGGALTPPLGGSSGGSGGPAAAGQTQTTAGGITYRLVVPNNYTQSTPNGLLVIFSGTEGSGTMTMNMQGAGPALGLGDLIYAVLDGPTYYDNGAAGASVLDAVRTNYNIDNDRTFLLSESAGTRAGLQLGFELRPTYFAALWANDVNASAVPTTNAATLGFAPWGNAGPGGDFPDANAIVQGMRQANYRISEPAPYNGAGAGTHGSSDQFIAALRWFVGRSRQ